jgi:hypothetical protein
MDSKPNSHTGDRKRTDRDHTDPGVDVTPLTARGSASADVEEGAQIPTELSLHLDPDLVDDATVTVDAYWYDDEPPEVRFSMYHEAVTTQSSLTPERARRLAAELRLAATHAEQGAAEAGWFDE